MPDTDPATRRYTGPGGEETELPRGDVTEGVVRVGGTVRRPGQPQSLAVAGLLDHLERAGFDGAPRFLGRDPAGRDVLSFLAGDVAGDPPERWAAAEDLLVSVADLLRRLHQASAGHLAGTGFAAPAGATWNRDQIRLPHPVPEPAPELVGHNDVTPQNVVVRDGRAAGLIDFDLAGPTTRLRDAFNTAMWWVPLFPERDAWPAWRDLDPARRLRLFADGYELDRPDRERFLAEGVARTELSLVRMRAAAEQHGGGWARMWRGGAGTRIRRRIDWMTAEQGRLTGALLGGMP